MLRKQISSAPALAIPIDTVMKELERLGISDLAAPDFQAKFTACKLTALARFLISQHAQTLRESGVSSASPASPAPSGVSPASPAPSGVSPASPARSGVSPTRVVLTNNSIRLPLAAPQPNEATQQEKRAKEQEKQAKEQEKQEKQAKEQEKQAKEQEKQAKEQEKQAKEQEKQTKEQEKQAKEQEKQAKEQEKQEKQAKAKQAKQAKAKQAKQAKAKEKPRKNQKKRKLAEEPEEEEEPQPEEEEEPQPPEPQPPEPEAEEPEAEEQEEVEQSDDEEFELSAKTRKRSATQPKPRKLKKQRKQQPRKSPAKPVKPVNSSDFRVIDSREDVLGLSWIVAAHGLDLITKRGPTAGTPPRTCGADCLNKMQCGLPKCTSKDKVPETRWVMIERSSSENSEKEIGLACEHQLNKHNIGPNPFGAQKKKRKAVERAEEVEAEKAEEVEAEKAEEVEAEKAEEVEADKVEEDKADKKAALKLVLEALTLQKQQFDSTMGKIAQMLSQ